MSIAGKHAYRFGYLKSEEWQSVRIARLAADKCKCQWCGYESWQNDAHHVIYPTRWKDTKPGHLLTLCRECHDYVHQSGLAEKISGLNPLNSARKRLRQKHKKFWSDAKLWMIPLLAKRVSSESVVVPEAPKVIQTKPKNSLRWDPNRDRSDLESRSQCTHCKSPRLVSRECFYPDPQNGEPLSPVCENCKAIMDAVKHYYADRLMKNYARVMRRSLRKRKLTID